jgi:acyl-CoA thioesterase FadM
MDLFLTLLINVFRTYLAPRNANVWDGTRHTFRPRGADLDRDGNLFPSRIPSYIDISLVKFFIQTRMSAVVRRKGWVPVVVSSYQVRSQPKIPKGRLQIHTQVVGWKDQYVEIWHTWSDQAGKQVLRSVYLTRVTQKGKEKVTGADMLHALGEPIDERPLSAAAARQLNDFLEIREANRKLEQSDAGYSNCLKFNEQP